MATGPDQPVNLPPGYTLEQQPAQSAPSTLPPGYTVEGQGAPQPTISAEPKASDQPMFGYQYQTPEQRVTMPLAKALMAAHDKLKEVENLTQEGQQAHPIQAKVGQVANAIEGFLFGNEQHPEEAIGTGKYGMATNPALVATTAPEAGEAVVQGVRDLATAGEGAAKAPGLVKQVMQGEKVAQGPAKAAIQGAAGAKSDASLIEGGKTILDEPLANIKKAEQAAYKATDDAAGFDLKAEKDALKNDQYKLKQLGNTEADQAAREKLTQSISDSQSRIADAEKKLSDAGIDPKQADKLHQQRMAGQDFKKAVVQNVSADGESVNVDGLLNAVKKLRTTSKQGDRLAQFLGGTDKADAFENQLLDAQKASVHAVKTREWIGKALKATGIGAGALGGAYELLRK